MYFSSISVYHLYLLIDNLCKNLYLTHVIIVKINVAIAKDFYCYLIINRRLFQTRPDRRNFIEVLTKTRKYTMDLYIFK